MRAAHAIIIVADFFPATKVARDSDLTLRYKIKEE